MTRKILIATTLMGLILLAGCSSGSMGILTAPGQEPMGKATRMVDDSHFALGLWQFTADPAAKTLGFTQLRSGNFHLNALPFLEPPLLVNLTLESVKFNGNIIEADIGLRHPFTGLAEYTGFDVCGILITNGGITGFDDGGICMAGEDDTHLLNPDGYSRWWNPAEFPVNLGTVFSYNDGLLGAPDSIADYNSTINAYKYFCDDLGPDDAMNAVPLAKRGLFTPGEKNVRHYSIELGSGGLVFNYAVDACWKFPSGGKPWTAPDDFPPDANRPEAWRIDVTEVVNTLWNDGVSSGGDLSLSIQVYDWQDAEADSLKVESPGNFTPAYSASPIDGGVGFSTYLVDIFGATPPEGSIDLLISVESDKTGYGGLLPGKAVTAYFTYTAEVSPEQQGCVVYVDDSNDTGIEDGSMAHPFNTVQEGVDKAWDLNDNCTVLVDDSGEPYYEQVDMKSGITVKSSNWDVSDGGNRAFIDGPDDEPETHSVYFNGVDGSALEGFRIGFAGPCEDDWINSDTTEMILIISGSDITIRDCLFTGTAVLKSVYPVVIEDATDVTVANCRMADIDRDGGETSCWFFKGVYAQSCPGLVVRNNIITNFRPTEDNCHINCNAIEILGSWDVAVKNNLIYHIIPHTFDDGGVLMEGIHIETCNTIEVVNNTIDNIDSCDAFFINQVFGYVFKSCENITFDNNIGTRLYSDGQPSPLARGVCGNGSTVICYFTDIWDIGPGVYGMEYYGDASPGTGCIEYDPNYVDPDNGEYDVKPTSLAQFGDPDFVDWDDTGDPSGNPDDTDTDTRSRMGCNGGPGGEYVGLLTDE